MGNRFVITDLHGNYNLFKAICQEIGNDDIVYCLGDCADRGPEGWRIIKEMLCDKRFIYLMGNHEKMLIDAMNEYIKYDEYIGDKAYLLFSNSGETTFYDWLAESDENRIGWLNELKKLPYIIEVPNEQGFNCILSHAGLTPHREERSGELIVPLENRLIWDRQHIYDGLNMDGWAWDENDMIIHGHTPIIYLASDIAEPTPEAGAFYYCHGHKICLDMLSAYTNMIVMFNLDTYEELILEV